MPLLQLREHIVVDRFDGAGDEQAPSVPQERKRVGVFQQVLLLYLQALITQISQTAVCNRLHSVEQQLCRWLLINHDQLPADKLIMTQDLIANMLGVRREGVSVAASNLQAAGIIEYSRGTITIVDREKLETSACECYQVVVDEYTRLLGEYVPLNDAVRFTHPRGERSE